MIEIRLPVSTNEEVLNIAAVLVKNGYIVKKREMKPVDSNKKINVVIAYTESEFKGGNSHE